MLSSYSSKRDLDLKHVGFKDQICLKNFWFGTQPSQLQSLKVHPSTYPCLMQRPQPFSLILFLWYCICYNGLRTPQRLFDSSVFRGKNAPNRSFPVSAHRNVEVINDCAVIYDCVAIYDRAVIKAPCSRARRPLVLSYKVSKPPLPVLTDPY